MNPKKLKECLENLERSLFGKISEKLSNLATKDDILPLTSSVEKIAMEKRALLRRITELTELNNLFLEWLIWKTVVKVYNLIVTA